MTDDARFQRLEERADQLRDKIGDTATAIYQRIDQERNDAMLALGALEARLRAEVAPPPWWQGAARLFVYGAALLVLVGGAGALIAYNIMPPGAWETFIGIAKEQAR